MLILQRKAGESLVIGEDITVSVVSVEGGRVRLAISAPKDTPILRSELVVAKQVNRDAAQEESAPGELLRMLDTVLGEKPAAQEHKKGGSQK
jgi:carbon storage regulator